MTARELATGTRTSSPLRREPDRHALRRHPLAVAQSCATRTNADAASSGRRDLVLAVPGHRRLAGRPGAATRHSNRCDRERVGAELSPPAEQRRVGNRNEQRQPARPRPPAQADRAAQHRPATTAPPMTNHVAVSTSCARCTIGSSGILEFTTPCVIETSRDWVAVQEVRYCVASSRSRDSSRFSPASVLPTGIAQPVGPLGLDSAVRPPRLESNAPGR